MSQCNHTVPPYCGACRPERKYSEASLIGDLNAEIKRLKARLQVYEGAVHACQMAGPYGGKAGECAKSVATFQKLMPNYLAPQPQGEI